MARRERGSGSAFWSEYDQCWVALVSLGVRDGKRIRKKARTVCPHKNPPKCRVCERRTADKAEQIKADYRSGSVPMTMTLDAYMADFLRDIAPTVRASTLRSYTGHVRHHISPLLGGMVVGKITPSDVRRLIAVTLRQGKSPATVGRIISTLHHALDIAHREGSLPMNAASVKLPKVEREPIRAMTPDDAAALLDAVSGHEFEAVYRLLLGSGMRLGEALGLDWPDVHLDEGYVVVRVSKTKVRAVPISEDAVSALVTLSETLGQVAGPTHQVRAGHGGDEVRPRSHENLRPDAYVPPPATGPVFVGPRKGKRLRGDTVYHAWVRLLERHGLDKMRVHDLRHGVATLMLLDGQSLRSIGDQLGHQDVRMTHKYAHLVPEAMRGRIGVLDTLRSKR